MNEKPSRRRPGKTRKREAEEILQRREGKAEAEARKRTEKEMAADKMRTGRPREEIDFNRFLGRDPSGKVRPRAEYGVWCNLKQRCLNPANPQFKNYGGRGITVCKRWLDSYDNFISDMGLKPDPLLTIERVNNNSGYRPGNCIWASMTVQAHNSRTATTVNGVNTSVVARRLGVSHTCLRYRRRNNLPMFSPRFGNVGGENSWQSKLTNLQVIEIREEYAKTPKYKGILKDIGKRYDVRNSTIFYIVNRRTWKHV